MDKFSGVLARRYLRGKRKKGISLINFLNVMGITLGVFALLTVISVMNGFDQDIREKILAFRSDLKISNSKSTLNDYNQIINQIKNLNYISSASPIVENELLIQSEDEIYGTLSYGIVLADYNKSTKLIDKIVVGHPKTDTFPENGIIIGMDLAIMLNVTAGEYIQISSPTGSEPTPLGLLPRSKRFLVQGIFVSGIPEYDQNVSYISLNNAQYFAGLDNKIDYIEVRSINPDKAKTYKQKLQNLLSPDVQVEDWSKYEANLFNAMQMEKVLMIIVLMLIVILASFNIAGNLNRMVTEKKTDIGIMKAWGVSGNILRNTFLKTGLLLGFIGSFLGTSLAYLFLLAQIRWQFITIPVTGFPITAIPVDIRYDEFIVIPLLSLVIVLLAVWFPSRKTNELNIIKIIRNT